MTTHVWAECSCGWTSSAFPEQSLVASGAKRAKAKAEEHTRQAHGLDRLFVNLTIVHGHRQEASA